MKAQSPAPTRSAAAAPVLLRETIGSIAVLTLNRPQARNSSGSEEQGNTQNELCNRCPFDAAEAETVDPY